MSGRAPGLALFYALEATDFHHENLIAEGEHPVPIDLETLFQPASPHRPPAARVPARPLIRCSTAACSPGGSGPPPSRAGSI